MIREAPAWFNDELERIGGTNRYGEPIFRLVWSEEVRSIIGGRFADGFCGYRNSRLTPGDPHWVLMMWEGPEAYGDSDLWEMDFRQADTGLLDCGSFPKHGRYRLLKQFIHRELVEQEKIDWSYNYVAKKLVPRRVQKRRLVTYKMEPCGLILDLMLPMLMAWRLLGPQQKMEAAMDRKKRQEAERDRIVKDAMHGSRINRGSRLVQKRAEFIDKGMERAMAIASRYAPGMRVG